MSTEALPLETPPMSLQTGVTPNPIASNTQDFTGSDDEILDNFADGPDPNDDGTPLGLGGEKGKQSDPASSTLEADIIQGTKQQPGPVPEKPAGEREQVQQPAGEKGSEPSPESHVEEPEPTPEFPPALLQMAGLADAASAKAAGFENPEALFAAVKWRGQMLMPGVQPVQPSEQGLYRRPAQRPVSPLIPEKPSPEPTPVGEVKPFQLPPDKMDVLDEDLQTVLRDMNQHYQQELASLRSAASEREAKRVFDEQYEEELRFDKAVENLGEDWQDVFGQGNGIELSRSGQRDPVAMTNFNHRAMLFEAVQAVREVNAKQGYKSMSIDQEVQWALMQRYPDKFQQTISGKGNSSQRRGVIASRPTQRRTPPKSQNDKLLSDVNAMLKKKRGYSLTMDAADEEFNGDI